MEPAKGGLAWLNSRAPYGILSLYPIMNPTFAFEKGVLHISASGADMRMAGPM